MNNVRIHSLLQLLFVTFSRRQFFFLILCVGAFFLVSCSKDNIPDPYQPVNLPKIQQLDVVNGNDSSLYYFDANMLLISGKNNTSGNSSWQESYTVNYQGDQLIGATYEYVQQGRNQTRTATYSRDERNILSKVTSEGWTQSISFSYDEYYRLTQVTVFDNDVVSRYTISYNEQSNVSSVECYRNTPSDSYTKWDYSDYDTMQNPFRFLINVFYAPAFSSNYGPVRYATIPLGMLLSVNNPGKMIEYVKTGDTYAASGNQDVYQYEYDGENYPTKININQWSLEVKYYR